MKFVEKVIERFQQKKPVAVMTRMLLANTLSASCMDRIFADHRVRQLEGELAFSAVADLMGEVVLQIQPSINAAHRNSELAIAVRSVYNKLQGIETSVSRAVVRQTAVQMMGIIDKLGAARPPLVDGYRTKIVDGNHLRHTDSRIGQLREQNVSPLPGKALVIYDPQYCLATDVIPCECGHASERSLLPELLETIEPGDLLIADRNFCTLEFLFAIASANAKFIVRQHGILPFELSGRRRRIGETETGIVYEQAIRCSDGSGNTRMFRRITVHLYEPTRDGDVEVHIITNLPKRCSAIQIANLYRKRWTIETAFQNMAENLSGEIKTLGYPKAALFSFCMALVSYNLFSVVRSAVGAVHGEEASEQFSMYYACHEVASTIEGMSVVLSAEDWRGEYERLTATQMARELKRIAAQMRLSKYKKNKWTPKKRSKPKKHKTNRQHESTHKLLNAARETG